MSQHGEAHETGHGGHGSVEKEVAEKVKGVNYRSWIVKMGWFWITVVVVAVLGWLLWSPLLYAKKTQPVAFNHLVHVNDAGMDCEECHFFDESGRFSGVPNTEMCLDCHSYSNPQNEDNEREMAFINEYVNEDDELIKPVEWLIYSKQPDCVFFPHIAHVEKGGFSCEECHGDIGRNAIPPPYYENRITRYSKLVYEKMKMGDCADCHTRHSEGHESEDSHTHGNNACFVCHK